MQGNRLDDLWPTFRRVLLQPPWRVPAGLRVVWVAIAAAGLGLHLGGRGGMCSPATANW